MKRFVTIAILSVTALSAAAAWLFAAETSAAAEAAPRTCPRKEMKKVPPPPHKMRNSNGAIWSAFARLTDAERKAMMELQRTDPEKFRAVMLAKAEEFRAARLKRRAELKELAEKIRRSTDEKERETLRQRLVAEIKTDFLNRLADHRRRVEEMKAHAARLERDLDRRTAEVDRAVEEAVQAMIEGREPKRPPRKDGMMPPPHRGDPTLPKR